MKDSKYITLAILYVYVHPYHTHMLFAKLQRVHQLALPKKTPKKLTNKQKIDIKTKYH